MKFPYKILYNENYWIIKAKIKHFIFSIKRILYITRERFNKVKSNITVGYHYWSNTIFSIVRVIFAVILLLFMDNFLITFFKLTSPVWFSQIQDQITKKEIQENIITILTIIVSVSGLLLALFYPLLATVASTAYARIRSDIRQILIRERYSRFLLIS